MYLIQSNRIIGAIVLNTLEQDEADVLLSRPIEPALPMLTGMLLASVDYEIKCYVAVFCQMHIQMGYRNIRRAPILF